MNDELSRIKGCLYGGAIGDAMGMPASFMTVKQIKETYGYIEDFLEPDRDAQKYHTALGAGDITDDTYESLIIARILIENKGFDEPAFNDYMRTWAIEQKMLESDVIGPSTRKFLTALVEGRDPKEGSKTSDTNGSAMRVAPIGLFYRNDFQKCVEAAARSSMPSHGSAPAVAGACAVAAAVAAGVRGGLSCGQVILEAARAAAYGESIGFEIPAPSVRNRILLAKEIIDDMTQKNKTLEEITAYLVSIFGAGMKVYESVPLSLGVFYAAGGNPAAGIPAAVNAGDDADTNGSICGAVCGAYAGIDAIPGRWIDRTDSGLSNLDFSKMAESLL